MFKIFNSSHNNFLNYIVSHSPNAISKIAGNKDYPNINGKIEFYQTNAGVLIVTDIENLYSKSNTSGFYAMHIHSGNNCDEKPDGEFYDTPHYNPDNAPHPSHAGDLTTLLSNDGYVFNVLLTNRFKVSDILNKVIMIHENPNDFRTDPSGNSGKKIACGKIVSKF